MPIFLIYEQPNPNNAPSATEVSRETWLAHRDTVIRSGKTPVERIDKTTYQPQVGMELYI